MPTSPFVEFAGWKIGEWNPDLQDEVTEGIPVNCFQTQGTMLIGLESTPTSFSYTLQWLNQSGEPCSVSGLQPDPTNLEASLLAGENLTVHFGAREVVCDLELSLVLIESQKILSGSIKKAEPPIQKKFGPETGSGTFTATANGGGN